jgi:hypothetical protein
MRLGDAIAVAAPPITGHVLATAAVIGGGAASG